MEVRVFGSIGVVDADGREVPLGGPKQRLGAQPLLSAIGRTRQGSTDT